MANFKIEKSAKTIEKEEKLAKLESIKNKSNITNSDLRVLLEAILEKLDN